MYVAKCVKVICQSIIVETVFQMKNIAMSLIVFFFDINIMKQKKIAKYIYFPIIKLVTCCTVFIKKTNCIAIKVGKIFSILIVSTSPTKLQNIIAKLFLNVLI